MNVSKIWLTNYVLIDDLIPSLFSAEVITGSQLDVVKIARQILNRGSAHRTVSKQECMVELTDLPLVLCSEMTESINLSGSYKLSSTTHNNLLSQYKKAAANDPQLSLHQFVSRRLNEKASSRSKGRQAGKIVIPHYVGAQGQPKYPPTKEYAMATLLVHKPWGGSQPPRLPDEKWISDFKEFVACPGCPAEVTMEYARVKERWQSKRPQEAVAGDECYDREVQPDMDEETKDILSIITNVSIASDPFLSVNDHRFDKGLSYSWSTRHDPVSHSQCAVCSSFHVQFFDTDERRIDSNTTCAVKMWGIREIPTLLTVIRGFQTSVEKRGNYTKSRRPWHAYSVYR